MSDLRDYVDLKADELKLRTTKGLSLAMGRLVAMLLLANLLIVVLALLAVVLIHWIGEWTGSLAVSSSIVCGVFLILLIVLFLLRKQLFRNTFVKLVIQVFYGDGKE